MVGQSPPFLHKSVSRPTYVSAVLVDKPVTAQFSQAQQLAALAKSKNLVLYPFQNRRWDSDFLALKKLLDLPADHPQSLGTLYEFESRCVLSLCVSWTVRC